MLGSTSAMISPTANNGSCNAAHNGHQMLLRSWQINLHAAGSRSSQPSAAADKLSKLGVVTAQPQSTTLRSRALTAVPVEQGGVAGDLARLIQTAHQNSATTAANSHRAVGGGVLMQGGIVHQILFGTHKNREEALMYWWSPVVVLKSRSRKDFSGLSWFTNKSVEGRVAVCGHVAMV